MEPTLLLAFLLFGFVAVAYYHKLCRARTHAASAHAAWSALGFGVVALVAFIWWLIVRLL